jgi:hypothetical protein
MRAEEKERPAPVRMVVVQRQEPREPPEPVCWVVREGKPPRAHAWRVRGDVFPAIGGNAAEPVAAPQGSVCVVCAHCGETRIVPLPGGLCLAQES